MKELLSCDDLQYLDRILDDYYKIQKTQYEEHKLGSNIKKKIRMVRKCPIIYSKMKKI